MSKRAAGEGTIVKHASGLHAAAIRLENGKRKWVYGKTRKIVREKLEQLREDIRAGRDVGEPSQKVGDYLQHWLNTQARLRVRPKTFESYELNVRRLTPYLEKYRLDQLRPAHVQAALTAMLSDGKSPHTVRQAFGVLRVALRDASKQRLVGRPASEGVTPPKAQRAPIRTLDTAQIHRLLQEAGPDFVTLWLLLVTTGMRSGEALGLRWTDVDLPAGLLHVRQAVQRQKGMGLVFVDLKTDKSRRLIHLSPTLVQALEQAKWRQESRQRKLKAEWHDYKLVFPTAFGKPLDPSNVWRQLQQTLDRIGLPRMRVHELRHTAATYLLSVGTHPKVVQDLLGHSSITLTLNTYSDVVPALNRQIAEQMEALVSGSKLASHEAS